MEDLYEETKKAFAAVRTKELSSAQVNFRLPKKLLERIKAAATSEGVSVTDYLKILAKQDLKRRNL